MHNGFYSDLDTLRTEEGCEDADFSFLESEYGCGEYRYNAYQFLHGYCYVFAEALHDIYGYQVENAYGENGFLVHSYCITYDEDSPLFIDVRGITDDYQEFIEEFGDFLEYDGEPAYPLPGTSKRKDYGILEDENWRDSRALEDAKSLIRDFGYWK